MTIPKIKDYPKHYLFMTCAILIIIIHPMNTRLLFWVSWRSISFEIILWLTVIVFSVLLTFKYVLKKKRFPSIGRYPPTFSFFLITRIQKKKIHYSTKKILHIPLFYKKNITHRIYTFNVFLKKKMERYKKKKL